nr:MAG TPA: hypothetical protein [Caudoviricetes sp.]
MSGIPRIFRENERSDKKRKFFKSVISIIIHNRNTQCRGACNRNHKTAVDQSDQRYHLPLTCLPISYHMISR